MEKLLYDPINLENIPINEYLDNDANNTVIILNKKAYGINKALFMFNNEMKRCIIANNALLKKATYDNPETFYDIGYFIGKKVIVALNTLNDALNKHRIIELTSKTTGDTYINKELLELTTIGILKPPSKKSVGKVNFKYAYEDVYFEKLISDFLRQYSMRLYYYLNKCLLNPDLYNKLYNNDDELLKTNSLLLFNNMFNNNILLNNGLISLLKKDLKIKKKKVFKNIDFKNAIDDVITNIDKVFIEAAPRYEKKYIHTVFYRGMAGKYLNTNGGYLENVGDTALILNYTSVSSNYFSAKNFALYVANPSIYKIYLEEGLPFINMVSTTKYKHEKEYLLPRNIIFEVISKNGNEYTLLAKPFKKDQFAIKTGCIPLDFYDIVPATPATLSTSLSSKQSVPKVKKSNADSGKSKNIIKPIKKRCPKGMVRNKITKECVLKANAKKNTKLRRCPKGTRRNPKTLLCESKL